MTLTPRRRDLIYKQRDALVESLKRFGYTNVGYSEYERLFSAESKPYAVYVGLEKSLVIMHQGCTDCWLHYLPQHERDFLHQMILDIGRLDAHAHYESGVQTGLAPRLRIQL